MLYLFLCCLGQLVKLKSEKVLDDSGYGCIVISYYKCQEAHILNNVVSECFECTKISSIELTVAVTKGWLKIP